MLVLGRASSIKPIKPHERLGVTASGMDEAWKSLQRREKAFWLEFSSQTRNPGRKPPVGYVKPCK